MKTIKYSDLEGPLPSNEGLKVAKNLVRLIEDQVKSNHMGLGNCAIEFGDNVVEFTPEEYIRFAYRSIELGTGVLRSIDQYMARLSKEAAGE